MIFLRPKMAPPHGSHFTIGWIEKKYETILLKALILGIQYHLVALYHVCSKYAPGANDGTAQGSYFYIGFYRENMNKYFGMEPLGIEPWYLVYSITQLNTTRNGQVMSIGLDGSTLRVSKKTSTQFENQSADIRRSTMYDKAAFY